MANIRKTPTIHSFNIVDALASLSQTKKSWLARRKPSLSKQNRNRIFSTTCKSRKPESLPYFTFGELASAALVSSP